MGDLSSPDAKSLTVNDEFQNGSFRSGSIRDVSSVLKKLKITNKFEPSADTELADLVEQVLGHMTKEDLIDYIKKVKRFDKQPVHVMQSHPGESLIDFSSGQEVFWWHLRKDLEILPEFFNSTEKSGLSYKEGTALLSSLVDSFRFDFDGVTKLIKSLTGIMQDCAEKSLDFKASVSQFEALFQTSRQDGETGRALGIIKLGIAAGMNIEQSTEIVTDIYNGRGIAGYVFMDLYDELDAIRANNVSGDLIFHSLKAILANGSSFSEFTKLLYLTATHTKYSLTEVLESIINPALISDSGKSLIPLKSNSPDYSDDDILDRAAKALMLVSGSDGKEPDVVIKNTTEYFPKINTKKLIHGVLPYRASRNLSEGLHDLHTLMKTEYNEGAWIFDPKSETWYSMGGRTNLSHGSVRQEFFPYDISALSPCPVFVHIHPEKSETFIRPHRESLVYPQLQDKVTKFLASMPSGSDFQTLHSLISEASERVQLKGLIVTSTGLTEMRVPNDSERIANFATTFRDLKDEVLLEFDAEKYLNKHGIEEPDTEFVKKLLSDLNLKLPDGFEIVLHDYNSFPTLTS